MQIDYVFTRLLNSRNRKRSNDRSLSTHVLERDTVVINRINAVITIAANAINRISYALTPRKGMADDQGRVIIRTSSFQTMHENDKRFSVRRSYCSPKERFYVFLFAIFIIYYFLLLSLLVSINEFIKICQLI